MPEISLVDDVVTVVGRERTLTHRPREVRLDDGTVVAHESVGGTLSSAWATDLGDLFVEVVHLGDGPRGAELVLVVTEHDVVSLGDLYVHDVPAAVPATWPVAIDLALGLLTDDTRVLTPSGEVTRADVEALHQRLLGVLHG
ncbi:hypothetical protein GCM10009821_14570 [Aeromicrobium halocynthiae]|uniref:Uncharacterized protein n=1 Tax=Aeromicrobium halocynthiae TaxID=560557 RepID=A0ABN2VXR6_9ACTN